MHVSEELHLSERLLAVAFKHAGATGPVVTWRLYAKDSSRWVPVEALPYDSPAWREFVAEHGATPPHYAVGRDGHRRICVEIQRERDQRAKDAHRATKKALKAERASAAAEHLEAQAKAEAAALRAQADRQAAEAAAIEAAHREHVAAERETRRATAPTAKG
jgi:hypothetical protein